MGVLSKRCLMPTTTNRIPNNRNYTPKEQKYRLDPEYVRNEINQQTTKSSKYSIWY